MLSAKSFAIRLLERHPYGYALGVSLLDHIDALLPHEAEYWGFAVLAKAFNFNPKVILDIGANRGHSARAFLKILPGWDVVSFEANAIHKSRLTSIKKRFNGQFTFHIGAITDAPKGDLEFYTPVYRGLAMHSCSALSYQEALRGAESGFPAQRGGFKVVRTTTPTLTIDALAIDASLIKLDVQGEELNALKGMASLLKRCKPVLLVETNLLEPNSTSRAELVDFLTALDYHPWTYNVESREFEEGWSDATESRNRFFIHASLKRSTNA